MEKLKNINMWPNYGDNIKESLVDWLTENDETILIGEGEDILDGLELIMDNKEEGITMETMMDLTEVITTLLIGKGLTSMKISPVFQQARGLEGQRE